MTAPKSLRVVLAAGGTGGHTFPAEALAETLVERGHKAFFLTDSRGRIGSNTVSMDDIHRLAITSPAGSWVARLRCLATLVKSYGQARGLLRAIGPDAVVGFGGYPSAPTVFAAARLKLPLILHEQNAKLGKTNRWMAQRADQLAMSFGNANDTGLPTTVTGNPVRKAVVAIRENLYQAPAVKGPINILVTGGSQGARALAQHVPAALESLPEDLRTRLWVTLQCPRAELPGAKERLTRAGIASEVAEFFDDIATRLEKCHLVINRSGASSVCEVAVAGRPAIFVPYPHHKDQQQLHNAKALSDHGGGWVMQEHELTPENLAKTVRELTGSPSVLSDAAKAAWGQGVPDAADRLADLVEKLAHRKPGNGKPGNGPSMKEAA